MLVVNPLGYGYSISNGYHGTPAGTAMCFILIELREWELYLPFVNFFSQSQQGGSGLEVFVTCVSCFGMLGWIPGAEPPSVKPQTKCGVTVTGARNNRYLRSTDSLHSYPIQSNPESGREELRVRWGGGEGSRFEGDVG